jgi:hypothetical protein
MNLTKIYLAIPYSGMHESSYQQSIDATVALIKTKQYNVFSPIIHSHPLTPYEIKGTWDIWQYYDYQFMDWADEVWVLIPKEGLSTVKNSIGVQAEIEYAKKHNKPVKFFEMEGETINLIQGVSI